MFRGAKARAKKAGLPFDLTLEDIVIPALCPALGTPMVKPSLDRTIPSLGYVKGNVQVISHRANRLKCDCTDANELLAVAAYIERQVR